MKRKKSITECGATMAEAALSIAFFLFVLISGIELAVIVYQKSALDHALFRAGRYAILGISEAGMSREESIEQKLKQAAREYGVPVAEGGIRVCRAEEPDCNPNDAGERGEWIYISAQAAPKFLTFLPAFNYRGQIVVRNEPF